MTMDSLFDRARAAIPGGVSSPVRAFGSVGGTPRFIASARGAYVTDADGVERVDLVCSWGPTLLGHAHPAVVEAVQSAAARGLSFGAPTEAEVVLAELVRERVPAAELVRFVSSGTEATMTAVRLARASTGRDLVVKFAGCYHGHVDSLLAEAGSGVATASLPGSAGVTAASAAETLVLPYNDVAALEAAFAERGDQIACVITEAAGANMGVVAPRAGFNAAIREVTARHGALMISDEVLTGFRVSPAGWFGLEGVVPDLFTFGKVVGGGMPLAALGGRTDLMTQLAPLGPVYQAGTLSGNPLSTAAGIATLRHADAEVYAHVDRVASVIGAAASAALAEAGVAHSLQRAGNLFSIMFGDLPDGGAPHGPWGAGAVADYAGARAQEAWRYPAFFHAMLDAGVALPPSVFEAWFVSSAHDDVAVDRILDALPGAARAAAAAEPPA